MRHSGNSMIVPLNVRGDTAEVTVWILMPLGRQYSDFRVIRYEAGQADKVEAVEPITRYMATDFTILAFKLLSVEARYNYEVGWTYK